MSTETLPSWWPTVAKNAHMHITSLLRARGTLDPRLALAIERAACAAAKHALVSPGRRDGEARRQALELLADLGIDVSVDADALLARIVRAP